ncbi:MAG TPA: sulfatase-like hydrolase/transferase, partial [Chryseolinea sp.]
THHYALEYITKQKPRVVFISFGETDDFAHGGKYDAYLTSAHQTDKFIEMLWNELQSQPAYKDKTTLIITTDHGRGTEPLDNWRSHGTKVSGSDQIWFAVLGPDTPAKGEMNEAGQYYQNQVAKTAATLLGVNYENEKKTGEAIKPALPGK